MFFNFGPFSFGLGGDDHEDQHNPHPPQQNNNQGGFMNGLNDFLMNGFMNPAGHQRPNQQQQHQQQQQQRPRPIFTRNTSRREQSQKQQEKQNKKQQPVLNENTGTYWKQKGNQAFKEGNYLLALKYYDKAIELNDSESVFFSNRARCKRLLGDFEGALKDAQEAVQLDVQNIKGHLISGQLLAEQGKMTKNQQKVKNSIVRLTKALTLCSGQKKNQFQNELSIYIYRAKKLLWYLKFQEIRETRIKTINEYKEYMEKDPNITKEQIEEKIHKLLEATDQSINFQVPDYLCCPITFDLMEDPVCTDSGQAYERSAIEEHMQKCGKMDPFTRKPISGNLYPSINLKKAIQEFLDRNPWAYEFMEGESYKDIVF